MSEGYLWDDDAYHQIQQAGVYFQRCPVTADIEAIKIGECLRGWTKMNYFRRPLTTVRQLIAFCPSPRPRPIEEALKVLFASHRLVLDTGPFENQVSEELFAVMPVESWLRRMGFVSGKHGVPAIIDAEEMELRLGLPNA